MTVHPNTIAYGLSRFNGLGLAATSVIGLRRNCPDYVKLLFKRTTRTQQRCVPTPTFLQTRTATPPAANVTPVPAPPPSRTRPAAPQTAAARPLPRSGAVL